MWAISPLLGEPAAHKADGREGQGVAPNCDAVAIPRSPNNGNRSVSLLPSRPSREGSKVLKGG